MTKIVMDLWGVSPSLGRRSLNGAAKLWFVVAAIGHWIFLAYLIGYYGPLLVSNGAAGLAQSRMPNGYVPGDFIGNGAAFAHIVLATIIIGGGPLQLIPAIRNQFPRFHHGFGRSYVATAVISSAAGLYMVWTRSTVGDLVTHIAISIDGILVFVCATFTLRYAIKRDFTQHRRWALRLFMVASAVWFFRVALMAWVTITGGIGIEWKTFTGPFIYFISFSQYLVPLIVLELYFLVQQRKKPAGEIAVATLIVALTLYVGVGIFAATTGMWLPRIQTTF